ncbi:MAG: hypothetical protein Q8L80_06845 [Gallionella sp.]|nr:hypothetical protein [Gallionella sp.]
MKANRMTPARLILRCYAEQKGNQWQAFCLEFDLAVQGESFREVKSKIEEQIHEYAYDALAGEDRQYSEQLLSRRAPIYHYIKFYLIGIIQTWMHIKYSAHKSFRETLPLVPA